MNWRFFVVAALLIKAKYQQWKDDNKNTGLFKNCMDFVSVRTKINKKNRHFFFVMLGSCCLSVKTTLRLSYRVLEMTLLSV
jgi:hypothetical protein